MSKQSFNLFSLPMIKFVILLLLLSIFHVVNSEDIPNCNYEDTVNLSGSIKNEDGSYLYEGILIPANLTGSYNYDILFEGKRVDAPTHMRGCVCKLRTCVKFCCNPQQLKLDDLSECDTVNAPMEYEPLINITYDDGKSKTMNVFEDFVIQQGIPCSDAYTLSPEKYKAFDEWKLFANGTLLRLFDMKYLSRSDYCFTPHKFNGIYTLNPMNCPIFIGQTSDEIGDNEIPYDEVN